MVPVGVQAMTVRIRDKDGNVVREIHGPWVLANEYHTGLITGTSMCQAEIVVLRPGEVVVIDAQRSTT